MTEDEGAARGRLHEDSVCAEVLLANNLLSPAPAIADPQGMKPWFLIILCFV
jgi:hypothetical protein